MKGQIHHATKQRRVKALYQTQERISAKLLASLIGKEVEVVCDGIDYDKNCFVGRAYFNAPDIDGKVYFRSMDAMQGKRYEVYIDSADEYDLYGYTEDYANEMELTK
jgi:tRNA A37 methylthiotransferase MiaB